MPYPLCERDRLECPIFTVLLAGRESFGSKSSMQRFARAWASAAALLTAASLASASLVHEFGGFVTVANRGEGTVSFIDPDTLSVSHTFKLPDDGEPMYIAYDYSSRSRILVADRKNERLVVAELRGGEIKLIKRKSRRFLPLPPGPFHTMSSQFFVTEVCLYIHTLPNHVVEASRCLKGLAQPVCICMLAQPGAGSEVRCRLATC